MTSNQPSGTSNLTSQSQSPLSETAWEFAAVVGYECLQSLLKLHLWPALQGVEIALPSAHPQARAVLNFDCPKLRANTDHNVTLELPLATAVVMFPSYYARYDGASVLVTLDLDAYAVEWRWASDCTSADLFLRLVHPDAAPPRIALAGLPAGDGVAIALSRVFTSMGALGDALFPGLVKDGQHLRTILVPASEAAFFKQFPGLRPTLIRLDMVLPRPPETQHSALVMRVVCSGRHAQSELPLDLAPDESLFFAASNGALMQKALLPIVQKLLRNFCSSLPDDYLQQDSDALGWRTPVPFTFDSPGEIARRAWVKSIHGLDELFHQIVKAKHELHFDLEMKLQPSFGLKNNVLGFGLDLAAAIHWHHFRLHRDLTVDLSFASEWVLECENEGLDCTRLKVSPARLCPGLQINDLTSWKHNLKDLAFLGLLGSLVAFVVPWLAVPLLLLVSTVLVLLSNLLKPFHRRFSQEDAEAHDERMVRLVTPEKGPTAKQSILVTAAEVGELASIIDYAHEHPAPVGSLLNWINSTCPKLVQQMGKLTPERLCIVEDIKGLTDMRLLNVNAGSGFIRMGLSYQPSATPLPPPTPLPLPLPIEEQPVAIYAYRYDGSRFPWPVQLSASETVPHKENSFSHPYKSLGPVFRAWTEPDERAFAVLPRLPIYRYVAWAQGLSDIAGMYFCYSLHNDGPPPQPRSQKWPSSDQWRLDGIAFYALSFPAPGTVPIWDWSWHFGPGSLSRYVSPEPVLDQDVVRSDRPLFYAFPL